MLRPIALLVGLACVIAAEPPAARSVAAAWPFRVTVRDTRDRAVPIVVVAQNGAVLIAPISTSRNVPGVMAIAPGDTLRVTTPVILPLDLTRGTVTVSATHADTVRATLSRVPDDWFDRAEGEGQRLILQIVHGKITIAPGSHRPKPSQESSNER